MTHTPETPTTDLSTSCWPSFGRLDSHGYGHITIGGKWKLVHRVVYEMKFGCKIPDGMTIDHLCRRRDCVNPRHMEVVTRKENVLRGIGPSAENARKTHCKNGHELIGENLLSFELPRRICKSCSLRRHRQWERKQRHALAAAQEQRV